MKIETKVLLQFLEKFDTRQFIVKIVSISRKEYVR